ncbi:uncharacterized protein BJ212DRAFT_1480169 [Suillus subaureus]|uniref:Uncharacterized protein n=1 Tax=Suillus subaureus TaxID=48587 RepID=A0A9P7JEC5_9AGAM|nr:uncharacterized protein BJ212DRAFT_1480169 [Suillus subaureus]KAG1817613.1 hypothetical protein BJ212DRAFT_1480169 [Suillus subaureus]
MNTRLLQRQHTLSISALLMPKSSSLTPPPPDSPTPALHQLPPAILLLALPGFLTVPALASDVESCAWTSLAKVGMRVMESGFCLQEGGCDWAVKKALSKGLLIRQKVGLFLFLTYTIDHIIAIQHPSLRPLHHHLTLLHAHFAFTFPSSSTSPKFACAILRCLIASFVPSDPPATVYNAHLTLIAQITTPPPSLNVAANTTPAPLGAPALNKY